NGLQEAVERGLDRGRDLSQMGVGDDEHAGGHGPKLGAAPERRKQRCCILPDVISTITLRVNYSETDQMGVVYHANYLIWFDRARTELMRETGVTYKELEQQGVYLAVSEVKVRYRAAARYDDLVRVRCRIRSACSAGLLLVLAATAPWRCGLAQQQDEALVGQLARLLAAADARAFDAALFRETLHHPDPGVRRQAALAIGRIGDPAGT